MTEWHQGFWTGIAAAWGGILIGQLVRRLF